MLILTGGHYSELKEVFGAALPAFLAVVGVSLLLAILAAIPPSALPVPILADFVGSRRRQVALAAISVCLSGAIGIAIVFWVL
jgi:hypothetical protein